MPQPGFQITASAPNDCDDLPAVLQAVSARGFVGIETDNLFRRAGDEERIRRLFAETGLALCGLRADFVELTDPEKLAENIRFVLSLGSRYLVAGGVGDPSLAGYRDAARLLNEIGTRCRDAGLVFCYHPRSSEFEDREGARSGIAVLNQESDPKLVKYCVDVDALRRCGVDPVRFIHDHRERAVYFRFDERGPNHGNPDADYLAAVALNPEWIVYRQNGRTSDRAVGVP